jgi:hypothetical protein
MISFLLTTENTLKEGELVVIHLHSIPTNIGSWACFFSRYSLATESSSKKVDASSME